MENKFKTECVHTGTGHGEDETELILIFFICDGLQPLVSRHLDVSILYLNKKTSIKNSFISLTHYMNYIWWVKGSNHVLYIWFIKFFCFFCSNKCYNKV